MTRKQYTAPVHAGRCRDLELDSQVLPERVHCTLCTAFCTVAGMPSQSEHKHHASTHLSD